MRTTLELPESLWKDLKHRAVDEAKPLKDVMVAALEAYLSKPPKKGGGS